MTDSNALPPTNDDPAFHPDLMPNQVIDLGHGIMGISGGPATEPPSGPYTAENMDWDVLEPGDYNEPDPTDGRSLDAYLAEAMTALQRTLLDRLMMQQDAHLAVAYNRQRQEVIRAQAKRAYERTGRLIVKIYTAVEQASRTAYPAAWAEFDRRQAEADADHESEVRAENAWLDHAENQPRSGAEQREDDYERWLESFDEPPTSSRPSSLD